MSHSQFHSIDLFILRHAWLNLWDKRMLLAESTRLLSHTFVPSQNTALKRCQLTEAGWWNALSFGTFVLLRTMARSTFWQALAFPSAFDEQQLLLPREEDGIRCIRFTVTSECVMETDCLATRYWAYRVGHENGAFLSNFDRNLTHSEYSEGSLLWAATLGVDHLSEPYSRRVPGISSSCQLTCSFRWHWREIVKFRWQIHQVASRHNNCLLLLLPVCLSWKTSTKRNNVTDIVFNIGMCRRKII